jgi:hypothetical protein
VGTLKHYRRARDNGWNGDGIVLSMKKTMLGLLFLMFLAPLVPVAGAQVTIDIGHRHHHRRHCWYSHHHRHCR